MKKLSSEEIKSLYIGKYVNNLSKQTIRKNRRLLKYVEFEKTDKVVDFGCGDGRFAHLINNQIKEYIGIDFSADFITTAQEKILGKEITNVSFICDDIISFCKKNPNTFDKAFALDFTEHVYDEELLKILISIGTSLKKDGELYIHTPNGEYFIEILKKIGILKQFPEHIAIRSGKEYNKLLKDAGFNRISIYYISHYERILRSFHFLSYIPLCGRYFKARIFMVGSNN